MSNLDFKALMTNKIYMIDLNGRNAIIKLHIRGWQKLDKCMVQQAIFKMRNSKSTPTKSQNIAKLENILPYL
jgi:hypothetical protein